MTNMSAIKKASIDTLNRELSLPATGDEQDWDIELADPARIGEFLTFYRRADLTSDDRVALMCLMLASVDRYLETESGPPEQWKEMKCLLANDRDLHGEAIDYWSRSGEEDPESWFHITPLVRAVV